MSTLESIRASLQPGQDPLEALRDLNTLLETNPSSAFSAEVANSLPLAQLFSILSLSSGKTEIIYRTCAVLDKIFSALPAPEVASYGQWIELGLQTSEESVKKTCLRVLDKHSSDPAVKELLTTPTMFHLVTQVVGDDSLECATIASNLLLKFLQTPPSLGVSVREALVLDLEALTRKSDTVRYRVYDLAVDATLQGGHQSFDFVSSTGFLDSLVSELSGDDVLTKLNCIELLIKLLDSKEGAAFLESNQILSKLHSLLISAEQDPLGDVIIPGTGTVLCCCWCDVYHCFLFLLTVCAGLLKFFGHVCLTESADMAVICERYPEFLRLIVQAIGSPSNTTLWGTSVDTLGAVGSSESGRKALLNIDADTKAALHCLGEFIVSGHTDIRVRCLRAVSMILSCDEEIDNWEESISLQWFNTIHNTPFQILMSIVKQPFQDLRVAGLKVLLVMASFEWGQRLFHSHAGFLEYLLDRTTEPDKEGKELKYEIVQSLVATGATAEEVFGNVDLLKLKRYEREGPFYSSVDTSVALEGM